MQPRGTDTVPAMLTPGEFIVNADDTAKNFGLLQAINNGYKPAPVALAPRTSGDIGGARSGPTFNTTINEVSDPTATAQAVARRQLALTT